jgi:putative ABC transport system permease protein
MNFFRRIFQRRNLYSDISEELRQHLEEKTEQLMREENMPRKEAEQAAKKAFGNATLLEEQSREIWQWPTLESIWADLKYALRQLRKSPGFAAAAILTLALGIGANTAVFSVVNAILLRPLAFPHPERLFQVEKIIGDQFSYSASIPLFLQWKQAKGLEHIAAYSLLPTGFNLAERGRPERIFGVRVSADFFRVLGITPHLGRNFTENDDRTGSPRVVLLGFELWRERYSADSGIVGKTILMDGQSYTVIGVLPRGFQFLAIMPASGPIQLWTPLQLPTTSRDPAGTLECIGRLASGISSRQASEQLTALSRRLAPGLPAVFTATGGIHLLPLQQRITEDSRPMLLLLFGAVGFVLLIACVNVANLLLARMGNRAAEIAIRTALGASHARIVRQMLTENLLLAFLGGTFGLLLAWLSHRILLASAPHNLLPGSETQPDGRVLIFAMAVSLATGILFGLFPALRVLHMGATVSLRGSASRSASSGKNHRRLSRSLVIAETALSLMLLAAAGLLFESFVKLQAVNPGFDYNHLSTFETTLPLAKYGTPSALQSFLQQTRERIRDLSGVEDVASVSSLPTESIIDFPFTKAEARPGEVSGDSDFLLVSAGYFDSMRIPILQGRTLNESDTANSPGVVIINQAMAKKNWPNQNPIGKRIVIAKNLGPDWADEPREIIGVVGDAKADVIEQPAPPTMYMPFAQIPPHLETVLLRTLPIRWIVRTHTGIGGLTSQLQTALLAVDPEEPVAEVRTMRSLLSGALLRWRFNMLLLGIFAAIALLLASVGIYGVISYAVAQRTQEIGIRMALGSSRATILWMILRHAAMLLAAGTFLGLAGAIAIGRVLKGFLYGVTPGDTGVLFAVSALMCSVGLLAAWTPARKAASIDPMKALRDS